MANKSWVGGSTSGVGDLNVAANWNPSGVPTGSDNIRIPASSTAAITASLTALSTVNGDLIVERGYNLGIGSTSATYLTMKATRFEFAGGGESYIDLTSTSSVNAVVSNTKTAAAGLRGLYLKATTLGTLSVSGGKVGLAFKHGETSTVTTARVSETGDLVLGAGVTLTTGEVYKGTLTTRCGSTSTDYNVHGGTLQTEETGKARTVTVYNGTANLYSSGDIKTLTRRGGTVDTLGNSIARTIATMNPHAGAFSYDPSVVSITTRNDAEKAVKETLGSV